MARLVDADGLNAYKAWVEIKTDDGAVIYAGKRKIVLVDDATEFSEKIFSKIIKNFPKSMYICVFTL